MGWIELGSAGVFRKEVTEPPGIKHPILVWEFGVNRLTMLRLGLRDLRELYREVLSGCAIVLCVGTEVDIEGMGWIKLGSVGVLRKIVLDLARR